MVAGRPDGGPGDAPRALQPLFSLRAFRDLGAAWQQESKDGETPYLAVKLDDPSFAAPMRAAFFENAEEGTGVMVWNRTKAG